MLDLSAFNAEQRAAVTAGEGPMLVIAGPGSGKTAVIVGRAAHLIDVGLAPASVLVLTFTNKAGREIQQRLASVLGDAGAEVCAGTFHAFALRLLRRWGDRFGFDAKHLSIYADAEDRRAALIHALTELGIDPSSQPLKGRLLWPEDLRGRDPALAEVYAAYQSVLGRSNALDFDDFLLFAVRLLEEQADVARCLRDAYRAILADEYQDVNYAQHRLLVLLSGEHGNLFAVGDPVQNVFSWRGSDIRYLLDFQREYPEAQIIALEQHYRSTQVILGVANALSTVLSYGHRHLWTANPPGIPVVLRVIDDPRAEAAFVTREVQRLLDEGTISSPEGCAVLYRTNAQARELELACLEAGLPYSVRGSSDFLARREIRDLLAYLRLLHNRRDVAALGRVVNTPPRRLAALERRIRGGEELTLPRLEAEFPCGLRGERGGQALRAFLDLVRALRGLTGRPPARVIEAVLERSGYRAWLREQEDSESRLANLDSFLVLADHSHASDLADFLDEIGLMTDLEAGSDPRGLALSTIHAAKGLEWPVVFVVGLEEGLLPHARALGAPDGEGDAIEEELRLCYVAITRAVDRLYLTYVRRRPIGGRTLAVVPSRFLQCIPGELLGQHAREDGPWSM